LDFETILKRFAAAVGAHDSPGLAALFTADGCYDDYFFGAHHGREAIAAMLDRFHEGGESFFWQFEEPVRSADLAYAERQFSLLGPLWSWHLMLLAVAHAVIAYAFASPLVLAASLTALAGWFGIGGTVGDALHLGYTTPQLGGRALACATAIVAWRYADRRARPGTRFTDVFDHFAANLAFWGAIAWCLEWPWAFAGLPLLGALAYASVRRGLRIGRESFLVYGVVYAAIGLGAAVAPELHGLTTQLGFVLVVVCAAAALLWRLRRRLREPVA